MARLIPDVDERELGTWRSQAEAAVFRALRRLGRDVLVVHGLATLGADAQGQPRDGEADFVVIDPSGGLLVIEVKGGGVARDAATGRWSSRDRNGAVHSVRDPFEQARARKHDLIRLLRERASVSFGKVGEPAAGHAVLFPDLARPPAVATADARPEIVGGRSEVVAIDTWVAAVFVYWAGASDGSRRALTADEMARVQGALCASFAVDVDLRAYLDREEGVRRYWTNAQWEALKGIRHWPRAAISGGAGTGKSLLALRRAQELSAAGQKALLVCFNAALGDHLKSENRRFIESGAARSDCLHTMTFHELCAWWTSVARGRDGIDYVSDARREYPRGSHFDLHLPLALANAVMGGGPGYDHVLVDEGQDFGEEYWLPIEILTEGRGLTIFFDPNQAIFRRPESFPLDPGHTYNLFRNCRNTRAIHEAAYRYYDGPPVEPPDLTGLRVDRMSGKDLNAQARQIARSAQRMLGQEGIGMDEIAVLVLDGRTKQTAYDAVQRQAGALGIAVHVERPLQSGGVRIDTVGRFKGLEAPICFLWINGIPEAPEFRSLLYVGMSRAQSILVLVGSETALEQAAPNA